MNKVAVVGYFFAENQVYEGQGVKTKIITEELEHLLGEKNLLRIDTYGWRKHPLQLLLKCMRAVWMCDHVIMMTDEGGIKIFPWLLLGSNILGKCRLHYIVIGGWLVKFLEKHKFLRTCLKRFDGIFVEAHAMQSGLEKMGFQNVLLMPNCKAIVPLKEEKLVFNGHKPYKLCTFSRVMKEKGIEDAINAVQAVNQLYGNTVFTLDIYGAIDSLQTEWFEGLVSEFPPEIQYCGVVPFDQSVEVIKNYYALLFPTRFYTEGIPGTIIDAYASGVPVISSEWENYADVIERNVTGITFPFEKRDSLKNILADLAVDPDILNKMKINCLKKANEYLPDNVIGVLMDAVVSKAEIH